MKMGKKVIVTPNAEEDKIFYPILKYIWILGILAFLAVLLFSVKFICHGWSDNPADWGVFGDYFGGVLNPIIALVTLLVTIQIALRINAIEKRNHDETVNSQVKPLFTINSGTFFSADLSKVGKTIKTDFYSYEEPQKPVEPFTHLHQQPFHIRLENIGLGLALKTEILFQIDFFKCKDAIDYHDKDLTIVMTHQGSEANSNADIGYIRYNIIGRESGAIKFSSQRKKWVGIVRNDGLSAVSIPNEILTAFQLFNLKRRTTVLDKEFPDIYIVITFTNIHGKCMTAKFKMGLFTIQDYPRYSVHKLLVQEDDISDVSADAVDQ